MIFNKETNNLILDSNGNLIRNGCWEHYNFDGSILSKGYYNNDEKINCWEIYDQYNKIYKKVYYARM